MSIEGVDVRRHAHAAARLGDRQPHGADGGLLRQRADRRARRDFGHAPADLRRQPGAFLEHAAREQDRKLFAAHLEPRNHRRRGQREFVGGVAHDVDRHRIAVFARAIDDARRATRSRAAPAAGDRSRRPALRARGSEKWRKHEPRQIGLRTAAVDVAHHRRQRAAANPVAGAFVAERRSPAAGTRGDAVMAHAVGDRSRSRNHARRPGSRRRRRRARSRRR